SFLLRLAQAPSLLDAQAAPFMSQCGASRPSRLGLSPKPVESPLQKPPCLLIDKTVVISAVMAPWTRDVPSTHGVAPGRTSDRSACRKIQKRSPCCSSAVRTDAVYFPSSMALARLTRMVPNAP